MGTVGYEQGEVRRDTLNGYVRWSNERQRETETHRETETERETYTHTQTDTQRDRAVRLGIEGGWVN